MKKLFIILVVLIVIGITYHLSSPMIANSITDSYTVSLNDERLRIGIQTISDETPYDSIEYFGVGNSEDFSFILGNEKSFSKGWTFSFVEGAYHKHKLIRYLKSYWFWENKILYEIDTYVKPLSKLESEELMVAFDYEENEYFARLDTVKTELAETLKTNRIDSIYQYADDNNLIICGTAMMEMELEDDYLMGEIDTIGISKNEVDLILKKWNIKLKWKTS